ncbi:MAG TPA: TonB-dependent receptor [Terriglobales bacterium]|nr:TonB-dependent receptor [Terriglobales bacterium]
MAKARVLFRSLSLLFVLALLAAFAFAQETTGGLQGTVRDPTSAVVSGAHVELTGTSLVGKKESDTDGAGYYRFANLPPGSYTLTITAKGFKTLKREGLVIEVGHLPTIDVKLEVGASSTVVEVSGVAPVIDVTTTRTVTNVTADVIQEVPHGYSFQSAIQFAPGARNEPLAGGQVGPNAALGTGTGGQSPGSSSNGSAFGFSIGGGADSENAYLVEGQETADAIGGFSHTNVPFAFIQEMQVKSSGIEAEYGGAMGGVINVVMEKGGNSYHGSVFAQAERGGWDGSPPEYLRYNPQFTGPATPTLDASNQVYQAKRDRLSDLFPGFTIGGPFIKDKLWFFASFNPEFRQVDRTVNWAFPGSVASGLPPVTGPTPFSRNQQTYYTNARIDWAATQKIRVFGSWLYQLQRESGEGLPPADSTTGLYNAGSTSPLSVFGHELGYVAPNVTTNTGLDYTVTPHLVGTFRWGYTFQNYHDFGYPTGSSFDAFGVSGVGALDNTGVPIPANSQLSQTSGFNSAANDINNTLHNVMRRNQIDGDVAWFKSGWKGTHNFKFGYQLMRLTNAISQRFNEPNVNVYPGAGQFIPQDTANWAITCPAFITLYGGCAGQYGYVYLTDYGSNGTATSMNHAFFAQDAWTIGHGVTINAGVRFEHEYLPAEDQPAGGISKPIQFGWGSKIAPRIGAAWDVFRNGQWKVFGSYGRFYDIMKLNLAISSFGGQYWNNCYYTLDTQNLASILPLYNSAGRYCAGSDSSIPGNFGSGGAPAGLTFIQNVNFREWPTTCSTCTTTEEGVAPNLKPYTQHESVFGIDHQLAKNVAFEARWDRRRLDDAIEDSSLYNPNIGETFVIVNPGKGVNETFDGFYKFLSGGTGSGCGVTYACPPNQQPASRKYDSVEFRLTKSTSQHWAGMFSYTYSKFRGNYSGLTNSDISDGGGGRNSPNNSRAFDEPYMSYSANGTPDSGPLSTDRPSVFKGYGYYTLPWLRKFSTDFGIFQYLYQGSPVSTFLDVGLSSPLPLNYGAPNAEGGAFNQYPVGWGNFVNASQAPDGTISVSAPYQRRTPWFTQSDLQLTQHYKFRERNDVSLSITVPNALNQHATVAYWESMDSSFYPQWIGPTTAACGGPCFLLNSAKFYTAVEHPYNWTALLNQAPQGTPSGNHLVLNSLYGQPLYFQRARNLYMSLKLTF